MSWLKCAALDRHTICRANSAGSYLSVMAQHLLLPLPGRAHVFQGMVQLLQTAELNVIVCSI